MQNHIDMKKIIRAGGIIAVICLIGGYTYMEVRGMLQGPRITLTSPENGVSVTEKVLTVSGTALNTRRITFNARDIIVDEEGNFSELHILSPGYNALTLRAEDRFDNEITKVLEIIYSPPDAS